MKKLFFRLISLIGFGLIVAATAHATTHDFYKGKTIRIIVGFSAGGGFDTYSRAIARHIGRHIPGSPTVIYMRADAPYKSIADIRGAKEPPKCGSTGTASSDYILARLLEEILPPLKIHTVSGYPGGAEIDVAVERGEAICRGMTASPFFGREPFLTWQKKNFVRVILYTGRTRDSRIPDTPTIFEIFEKEKVPEASRRVAEALLATEEFGRPMIGPPGTPADRVKLLRSAYEKAMKDSELLEEAKKGRMDMDPTSGEELEKLANRIMDQPPEVLERVKRILK